MMDNKLRQLQRDAYSDPEAQELLERTLANRVPSVSAESFKGPQEPPEQPVLDPKQMRKAEKQTDIWHSAPKKWGKDMKHKGNRRAGNAECYYWLYYDMD